MRLGIAAACCTLIACSHAPVEAPKQDDANGPDVMVELNGDELIRTFDLNHDGKPDDWKHYKLVPDLSTESGKPKEILVRRELDTNFDGKVDLTTWFNEDGTKAKESFDLDFDGKPDVVDTYEKGVIVKKETFHGHGDRPDSVAYYEGGKKVRIERETRGTGKVDTWEYFENGRLTRVGEDLDGDGLVDRWMKAKEPEDEEPQGKKAAAAPAKK